MFVTGVNPPILRWSSIWGKIDKLHTKFKKNTYILLDPSSMKPYVQ